MYSGGRGRFFFDTKILFFLNIFLFTCHMSLILLRTDRSTLGLHSGYLGRHQMGIFLKGGVGKFFQGDPYVTYRGPKFVSDD